ncbi:YadA-like family protein [uncultured Veillonella sp.]|uniref:YadA-like family protein n=1 Tax=uncultured Veillonella sp. TaxID=159268 RepID=UPI002582C44B|nr:YadA-like family protein [uncultured Veillonella sp.]
MMKRSQTKKISAMLAAMAVLWGVTLFFGGDSISAAVDQAAVLKKVVESGNTDGLTDEEKTWFTSFFGGMTLQPSSQGNKAGALVLSYGNNGEPQIGESNRNVKGRVNGNGYLENSGIVYGINNDFAGQSYVLGDDNIAMVNNNEEGVAIGYQNNMIANGGIGIGMFNKVIPTDHENEGYTSNGIAIGKQNLVHSTGIVVGQNAISSADASIAIGQRAIASGSLEAANAYIESVFTPGSFHYAEYLQKNFPNIFGKYDASQTEYQRMDKVDPILFEKYKWWFQKSNIGSYEKLIEQFGGGAGGEHSANAVMSNFGWKYALTQKEISGTTAIGYMAKATNNWATALGPDATASGQFSLATGLSSRASGENGAAYGRGANASATNAVAAGYLAKASAKNSSALGAFSIASSDYGVALGMESESLPEDVVEVEKAPYSEAKLSVNGNGKTGADNDILRGPVSFGSKFYNKQGVQTATYIRQVQYVADGTHDTDAVNLRQLRGALFNGIKAGDGVTITKQDDPTKPDYGTITVTATNTNTGNATTYSFEAGDNVTVTSEEKDGVTHVTISATDKDTTYTAGENVTIENGKISAKDTTYTAGENVTIDKDGKISAKDTTYTAGENVTIENGKISAKDTTYTAGENVTIENGKISAKDTTYTAGENVTIDKNGKISAKDTTYTAGENVTIENGKISAKDTTYTAGENVTIDKDGKISAKDTTYTAGENVTIDKDGKISAKDTTYTAGENVTIDKDGKISAKDTTYTAGSNLELTNKTEFSLVPELTNIESIKGKDNTKGELKFTTEGVELSHQTNSLQVGNEIKATAGNNTLVLGDTIEAKSGNNSLSVGDAIKAIVGTNSLTVGKTIEAKAGQNLFALSDNDLTAAVGQAHMTIDTEKWETVFNDATSTVMKDASITTTAGKSTLALSDTTSTLTVGNKDTGSTAMSQTTDTVAWTVTGKAAEGKPAPTTTVSITAEGLDVGKTIIHNLADGKAPTDAVNFGQLTEAKKEFNMRFMKLDGDVVNLQNSMNGMNTRITKLDRRVDKVGAGAAALAALHPLDFDPDNKWDIAGGYGHYAGQSAMALGAYYRPNEDVMFSIGGAFGNGEDMINAGVSVKVGSGESKTTTSKTAMAKEIKELRGIVATQQANMEKQEARIQELEKMIQKLVK